MKTTKKVELLCIFSALFIGCYSSVLVDPAGPEKGQVYERDIEMIITKDGTRYDFVEPPAVISDAVVGILTYQRSEGDTTKQVSIPLANVQRVQVAQYDSGKSELAIVAVSAALVASLAFVISQISIPF